MRRRALAASVALSALLSSHGGSASPALPSLAGVNTLSSVGTNSLVVRLPVGALLALDPLNDDLAIQSDGRFAAVLIRRLGEGAQARPLAIFFRTFPPEDCTAIRCWNREMDVVIRGERQGQGQDLILPPADYEVIVLADGGHSVTARLALEGPAGTTHHDLAQAAPGFRMEYVPVATTEGSTTPAMQGGVMNGGATGTMSRPGILGFFAWRAMELGRFGSRYSCIDRADSTAFDEMGHCIPERATFWRERDAVGLNSHQMTFSSCGTSQPKCLVGVPMRVAVRLEHDVVTHSVGAAAFWFELGSEYS